MYKEVRANYIFGPAVDPNAKDSYSKDLYAGIAVDGWETLAKPAIHLAQVLISRQGDVITAWFDNEAKSQANVTGVIQNAMKMLTSLWKSEHEPGAAKYIYLKDDQGDMDLILIHNWDLGFNRILPIIYANWKDTQSDSHDEIFKRLADAGYCIDIIPCETIQL